MGKGRPWCEGLKLVSVHRTREPKGLTIILPYYENSAFLQTQIRTWWDYDEDVQKHLQAIVVDDGSPVPAALPSRLPFPIRLFRIEQDIRWNWLAARNIGAHHAGDGWLLLTDMDHVVPLETARRLVYGAHDPDLVYAFSRREHTGEKVGPHSASFLMTKAMFWRIGGYDERYSGYYGTDGVYRRRLRSLVPMQILTDDLIRHEYVGDSSTKRYLRKQPEDAAVSRIAKGLKPGAKPKVLTFPYHEVIAA